MWDYIKNTYRMAVTWFTLPVVFYHGSRKLHKWDKKNKKEQDPSLYPIEDRLEYHRKKMKGLIKRMGINLVVEGMDNIPRGATWIVPNHTSNLDGAYLAEALGHRLSMAPVAKDNLKDSKVSRGYFTGVDGMFLDRKSPRQAVQLLDGAAQFAKSKNRSVVIFPEGKRSLTGELLDFKNGLFKFPQKYFLPILPVTITGTLEARKWFSFKTRTVTVTVHKPIKPINHSKLPTEIISRKIKEQMQKDIDAWYKTLSEKEIKKHKDLQKRGQKTMNSYAAKGK